MLKARVTYGFSPLVQKDAHRALEI